MRADGVDCEEEVGCIWGGGGGGGAEDTVAEAVLEARLWEAVAAAGEGGRWAKELLLADCRRCLSEALPSVDDRLLERFVAAELILPCEILLFE